jgi:hypothetical protein
MVFDGSRASLGPCWIFNSSGFVVVIPWHKIFWVSPCNPFKWNVSLLNLLWSIHLSSFIYLIDLHLIDLHGFESIMNLCWDFFWVPWKIGSSAIGRMIKCQYHPSQWDVGETTVAALKGSWCWTVPMVETLPRVQQPHDVSMIFDEHSDILSKWNCFGASK